MNSDALKTLLVAAILCVVCSVLVSGAAVILKPNQEANKILDVKKNLLLASGLIELPTSKEEIEEAYSKIQAEVIDLESGQIATEIDPKTFNQVKASKDPKMNVQIPIDKDIIGLKMRSRYAPVYKYMKEGKLEMVVLPVKGKGLWSTLYGFLALGADLNTIKGLGFYSHGETPGLGGEIDNPSWKAQWNGKEAFGEGYEEVKIQVIKGSVDPNSSGAEHKIDGLSGATITSNGVTDLVQYWLGDHGFGPYLDKLRADESLHEDGADASQSSDLESTDASNEEQGGQE